MRSSYDDHNIFIVQATGNHALASLASSPVTMQKKFNNIDTSSVSVFGFLATGFQTEVWCRIHNTSFSSRPSKLECLLLAILPSLTVGRGIGIG